MDRLVSIIVPVFNVEVFIKNCLESIIEQTYKKIEIIVVDDGSTDSSGIICQEFAVKDSRIKVYKKNNGGLMSAWVYGLNKAKGEYIAFVDGDD
ncbi:glycosyltransferase family 2 protein [Eubacterium aggregans]